MWIFLVLNKELFLCYISGNEKNVKLEEVQQNSFFFEEYVQDDPLFNCDHINTQVWHGIDKHFLIFFMLVVYVFKSKVFMKIFKLGLFVSKNLMFLSIWLER